MRMICDPKAVQQFEAAKPYMVIDYDSETDKYITKFKEGTPQEIIDGYYESINTPYLNEILVE